MKKIAWMGLLFVMTIGLIFTLVGGSGSYSYFKDVEKSQGNIFQAGTWGNPADTTPPVITLIGDETVNLKVGDTYEDASATATDDVDGDITANVITVNPIDTNTAGPYTVTYNVSDAAGNPAIEVTRTVIVSEVADTTPPVITLLGDDPINLTVGDSYEDAGATATDNVDGDITADIVVINPVDTSTAGTYIITYNVSDAAANPATEVTRTVVVSEVADTTPPVITLTGDETVSLEVGGSYEDAGATAIDDVDGDITENIVVVNPVDTSEAGEYTITYNVSDTAGNKATEVTRTVNVQ